MAVKAGSPNHWTTREFLERSSTLRERSSFHSPFQMYLKSNAITLHLRGLLKIIEFKPQMGQLRPGVGERTCQRPLSSRWSQVSSPGLLIFPSAVPGLSPVTARGHGPQGPVLPPVPGLLKSACSLIPLKRPRFHVR